MRLRRRIVSLALVALPVAAQQSESSQPIFDVQLRVSAPGTFGRPRRVFARLNPAKRFPPSIQKIKLQAHKIQRARTI